MRTQASYAGRPWVAPEACSAADQARPMSSDLRSSIELAEHALDQGSIKGLIHALVALRSALKSRLGKGHGYSDDGRFSLGPWQRRLRRRYAASLCTVERLLKQVWSSCNPDAVRYALRDELARLRRVEAMETRAYLERYWTDLGVGD